MTKTFQIFSSIEIILSKASFLCKFFEKNPTTELPINATMNSNPQLTKKLRLPSIYNKFSGVQMGVQAISLVELQQLFQYHYPCK